jgi:aminopeptidase N
VLLADKDHDRIVSLYSSRSRGIRVVEREDFRILSYRMNLKYAPGEMLLSGTAEILLSSRETNSSVVFKLNPALRVSEVQSSQGPLLYFQEKSTNNLHVILNQVVEEAENVRLRFHYEGVIPPDKGRAETQISATQGDTDFFLPPTYLYSNQAQWYPQLTSKPYSQVETTIEVPEGYAAIANGQLVRMEQNKSRSVYTYASDLPVKYFSLLVGRLRGTLERESIVPLRVFYYSIDKSSAGKQADATDRILRYYAGYFGRYPYRSLNLALRPAEEPGGHAPAGVVITNRVFSILRAKFERDPLYIPAYPDFLLAHEIAHQWWGQAVGWRSYRDQWLSEGFAQFAAAEYIRSVYGDKAWIKISEEFRDWIEEKTAAGPIVLGTRLGHLTNDPRAFSALLYNKGAYVLNMLKGWLGDEQFRKCLAEFYELYRYKKAGVEDFILLAREYSQEDLTPFFEQWLHGWTIPQVTWSWSSEPFETGHLLRLRFRQPADDLYHLKVPVEATDRSGQTFRVQALINSPDQQIEIQLPFAPSTVIVDPLRENLAVYIASK